MAAGSSCVVSCRSLGVFMQETQRVGEGEASTRKAPLKKADASSSSVSFRVRKDEEQLKWHKQQRQQQEQGSRSDADVGSF